MMDQPDYFSFFFFNDTATTEISPLPLHAALPILRRRVAGRGGAPLPQQAGRARGLPCGSVGTLRRPGAARTSRRAPTGTAPEPATTQRSGDRKSTRLNSSHGYISYAVFCLKKKKK